MAFSRIGYDVCNQYGFAGTCLNIQVGSDRRIGLINIITENSIIYKQNIIVMMLII